MLGESTIWGCGPTVEEADFTDDLAVKEFYDDLTGFPLDADRVRRATEEETGGQLARVVLGIACCGFDRHGWCRTDQGSLGRHQHRTHRLSGVLVAAGRGRDDNRPSKHGAHPLAAVRLLCSLAVSTGAWVPRVREGRFGHAVCGYQSSTSAH